MATLTPWQAALLRFAGVVIALVVGVAVYLLIPDPSIRAVAASLVVAATMALEEYVKTLLLTASTAANLMVASSPTATLAQASPAPGLVQLDVDTLLSLVRAVVAAPPASVLPDRPPVTASIPPIPPAPAAEPPTPSAPPQPATVFTPPPGGSPPPPPDLMRSAGA